MALDKTISPVGGSTDSGLYNVVHGSYSELVAWIVLNMWTSHLGLPILVCIILFSKKVQRHPTFVNMCIVWIIVGISSSLLVYSGNVTGPEPPIFLCLTQASLLYSVPATTSMAALMLVLQMFTTIRNSLSPPDKVKASSPYRLWAMLVAPYVVFVLSALATAIVGAANPSHVNRNRRYFYCSVKADTLSNYITGAAAAILLVTLVLEVWTLVLLYKKSKVLRSIGSRLGASKEANFAIRIIAFGVYLLMGLSLSLISWFNPASPIPDIAIATSSSAVILIFGTQPDIVNAMCFWRKDNKRNNRGSDVSFTSGARSSIDKLEPPVFTNP